MKREKVVIEQGCKVDDLKSELEAVDQMRLELADRLRRAQECIVTQDGELRTLREEKDEREVATASEIKAIQEEVESIYALARFTARAALMRKHGSP